MKVNLTMELQFNHQAFIQALQPCAERLPGTTLCFLGIDDVSGTLIDIRSLNQFIISAYELRPSEGIERGYHTEPFHIILHVY